MPKVVDFMRPAPKSRLSLQMRAMPHVLETRLAELLMSQLLPCDLGDGIEVVHDVEAIEVEMECDLSDELPPEPGDTEVMLKYWFESEVAAADAEDAGTREFVRFSAPYERIEIEIDANAYRRSTIAHARKLTRPPHALERHHFASALDQESGTA